MEAPIPALRDLLKIICNITRQTTMKVGDGKGSLFYCGAVREAVKKYLPDFVR